MEPIKKLELRHLAPYYGHKLQILDTMDGFIGTLIGLEAYNGDFEKIDFQIKGKEKTRNTFNIKTLKPLLRPLSDLTKEITVNGDTFVPADIIFPREQYDSYLKRKLAITELEMLSAIGFSCAYYAIVQKLFEWKFDVFSLIENNLSIDLNTIQDGK